MAECQQCDPTCQLCSDSTNNACTLCDQNFNFIGPTSSGKCECEYGKKILEIN